MSASSRVEILVSRKTPAASYADERNRLVKNGLLKLKII